MSYTPTWSPESSPVPSSRTMSAPTKLTARSMTVAPLVMQKSKAAAAAKPRGRPGKGPKAAAGKARKDDLDEVAKVDEAEPPSEIAPKIGKGAAGPPPPASQHRALYKDVNGVSPSGSEDDENEMDSPNLTQAPPKMLNREPSDPLDDYTVVNTPSLAAAAVSEPSDFKIIDVTAIMKIALNGQRTPSGSRQKQQAKRPTASKKPSKKVSHAWALVGLFIIALAEPIST